MEVDALKQRIAGEIVLSEKPGAMLRKWREIFEISQVELARALKISSSTISDYESNRRKSPGVGIVKRFVEKLLDLDAQKGGKVTKRFIISVAAPDVFETFEFSKPINGEKLASLIEAKTLTGEERLKALSILGCTILDSVKAILELPYEDFLRIYGATTQRALIFTNVETGRSTLVAIRLAPIKPALVVLHNVTQDIDKLALKIAEREHIPLLLTHLAIEEIKKRLKEQS